MRDVFGGDKNPSGMMAAFGARPGAEERYKANCCDNVKLAMVTFTTTRQAIKQVLPYPLQPALDVPPTVAALLWDASDSFRGWDGVNRPYQELGLWLPAKFRDVIGLHLFHLYMDGPGGYAAAICGREAFGTTKELGTVQVVHDGDVVRCTAGQLGVPRITITADCPHDVPPGESPLALTANALFVKEIPNCTFTGYDVRKVISASWGFFGQMTKSIKTGTGTISLGAPLDVLEVVQMGPAYRIVTDAPPTTVFEGYRELADLLKGEA